MAGSHFLYWTGKCFRESAIYGRNKKTGQRPGELGEKVEPQIAAGILTGTIVHYVRAQFQSHKIILSDQLAENIITTLFWGCNE